MTLHDSHLLRLAAASAGAALLLTLYVSWQLTPVEGDLTVIRTVQDWDFVRGYERWVNPLGMLQVQLPLALAGISLAAYGARFGIVAGDTLERTRAIWTLLAALMLRTLALPLKDLTQAQRPSAAYNLHISADFPGYGFPSGHVFSDMVIFGTLAVFAPALLGRAAGAFARVVCLAIIVLAGPARMVVGAHWPSDVLGGYLWGATALCVALLLGRRLASYR